MEYDFKTLVIRDKSGSSKWQGMLDINANVPQGIAPLSVADVDIKLAPEIQEGLIEFLKNDPVFGYSAATDEYNQAVISWLDRHLGYSIKKEWIVVSNGVVPALNDGVRAFTQENDGVIIMTPVYYPFSKAITNSHRQIVKCPLINGHGTYSIDFELFEQLAKEKQNKLLILCSPHNPVGRVWKKTELERIAEICLQNDVLVISDEIHADLVLPGHEHIPFATLSQEVAHMTITCTAASKSFNIAGLQGANIIIENEELREKFKEIQSRRGFHALNTISYEATRLAYTKGEPWLLGFLQLIDTNYHLLLQFIEEKLPKVKVSPLQGTYLAWLDFRAYQLSYQELEKRMQNAYLFLDEGYVFGSEGEGFERINIATPSSVLMSALERLYNEFKDE